MRYYRKAAEIGNHSVAYSKCGDFYYSKGDKRSAMICYKRAAELGDVSAYNSVGLMLEHGYDDVLPTGDVALRNYKIAHSLGSSDATINIAMYYLSGKFIAKDVKIGEALLLKAY